MNAIKYEPKYRSLGMMDKMTFRKAMLDIFINLAKADSKKLELMTPEFVLEHISERGYNRLRKIREMDASMRTRVSELGLTKDDVKDMIFRT